MKNNEVPMDEYEAKEKKTSVAILWLFFFGPFGAHDFYLKRIKTGFCKLLLCAMKFAVPPPFPIALFVILLGWCLIDFYRIRETVSGYNLDLIEKMASKKPNKTPLSQVD